MADPSPIRLLLIEDSDIDALFVTRLLKSNPKVAFEIDHATTLADALVRCDHDRSLELRKEHAGPQPG